MEVGVALELPARPTRLAEPGPADVIHAADVIHLADLAPGCRARVVEIVADGAVPGAQRLVDLGFTPGTEVHVVRRAPLRDPVVYRVKDYEICLRRAQAGLVRISRIA
jgi:ferrous iron transport protein A